MCKVKIKKYLLIFVVFLISFIFIPVSKFALAADLYKNASVGEYVLLNAAEIFAETDLENIYPINIGGYSQPIATDGLTADLYLADDSLYNYVYDISLFDDHIIKFKATEPGLYTFNAFLWDLLWDENIPVKEYVVEINVTADTALLINDLDGDSVSFVEDSLIQCFLDSGIKATVSSSSSWNGGSLKLEFASGLVNDEDSIAFNNTGNGTGSIYVGYTDNGLGISDNYVKYEGVVIGTFSKTLGSSGNVIAMSLNFNTNATNAAVSALLQNLYYTNYNYHDPNNGLRTVKYSLTDGISNTATALVDITVVPVNEAPELGGADIVFLEADGSVVLGNDIELFDPELSAGNGNYAGAFLTVLRDGGADDTDIFSAKSAGTLGILTEKGALITNGINIGDVTQNSGGVLILTFNSNATNELMLSTIRQIAYSNQASVLPDSLLLNMVFNDGNDGSQGTGGALADSVLIGVNIIIPNKAPVVSEVSVTGIAKIGEQFTGNYVYTDAENDEDASTFKWYRSSDAMGNDKTEISGANTKTYTLTAADANRYISFVVMSAALTGTNTGTTMESELKGPITKRTQEPIIYNSTGITKTYGDVVFIPTPPSGGSGKGLFRFVSKNPAIASVEALTGKVSIHKAGTVTLTVIKEGDNEYESALQTCELVVNPKTITVSSITIEDKLYDATSNAQIKSVILSGIMENDEVIPDTSCAIAVFSDENYAYNKFVTVNGIALSGADAVNYVLNEENCYTTGNILSLGTVISPEANVLSGLVLPGTKVALACNTDGAAIYYTTDGSTPTTESILYNGDINIDKPMTIKAVAIKQGMKESSVMSVSYNIFSEVTAADSTEFAAYIECPCVDILNLVSDTTYSYNGTSISRTLTINGNGAVIEVGTGTENTLIKRHSGIQNASGKIFFNIQGQGTQFILNDVLLQNSGNTALAVINVKAGSAVKLENVVFKDFRTNQVNKEKLDNFCVNTEPKAKSLFINNCSFGASNNFINTIALRGGNAVITNNNFVGSSDENSSNNKVAICIYGGTVKLSGNNISAYNRTGTLSAGIVIIPYYTVNAEIEKNYLHNNMKGFIIWGSWHDLSYPSCTTVNGIELKSSLDAYLIGEILSSVNTFAKNREGEVLLYLDKNDYYTDINDGKHYQMPVCKSAFIALTSDNQPCANLKFQNTDTAKRLIANAKSLVIEASADNGLTWFTATTNQQLGSSSTGATVLLASGKTYKLRAKLSIVVQTIDSNGNEVTADIVCYSNTLSVTVISSGGGSNNKAETVLQSAADDVADAVTSTNENGQKITMLTVDLAKLKQIIEDKGKNSVISISSDADSDVVVGILTGEMLKKMEQNEATLAVETNTAVYRLAASQIDIDSLLRQLGQDVVLSDVKIKIQIKAVSPDNLRIVENITGTGGFTIVAPAVEFNITCIYDDKTVEVKKFNNYVERIIAIPEGVEPLQITTGIVLEPDGSVRHVPTQVILINGKYYAKINSLTNSIYTLVWHPVEFSDLVGHWAKDCINDMGSRMIINGVGNNLYDPEGAITRAEFAAIMVRAMGLQEDELPNSFKDVKNADWYFNYVNIAVAYEMINGHENSLFVPNDQITREQAMTIIARVMKIAGLEAPLDETQIVKQLSYYNDAALVSDYAKAGVAACLQTGIVSGKANGILAPKEYISRAEVAVIVKRLLQKADLI